MTQTLDFEDTVYGRDVLVVADIEWHDDDPACGISGHWTVDAVRVFPDGVTEITVDAPELERLTVLAEKAAETHEPPYIDFDDDR